MNGTSHWRKMQELFSVAWNIGGESNLGSSEVGRAGPIALAHGTAQSDGAHASRPEQPLVSRQACRLGIAVKLDLS